jgi:hypothetical protein
VAPETAAAPLQAFNTPTQLPEWEGWVWAVVLGICGLTMLVIHHQLFYIGEEHARRFCVGPVHTSAGPEHAAQMRKRGWDNGRSPRAGMHMGFRARQQVIAAVHAKVRRAPHTCPSSAACLPLPRLRTACHTPLRPAHTRASLALGGASLVSAPLRHAW